MTKKQLICVFCAAFVLVVGITTADGAKMMYRVDAGADRIVTCNLDGTNETVLINSSNVAGFDGPSDLTIVGGKMYFGTAGDEPHHHRLCDRRRVAAIIVTDDKTPAFTLPHGKRGKREPNRVEPHQVDLLGIPPARVIRHRFYHL